MWLWRHGEALEADLAYRGIDLLDFYRGRMTARRLWVLARHLPPESAFLAAMRADEEPEHRAGPARPRLAASMGEVMGIVSGDALKR